MVIVVLAMVAASLKFQIPHHASLGVVQLRPRWTGSFLGVMEGCTQLPSNLVLRFSTAVERAFLAAMQGSSQGTSPLNVCMEVLLWLALAPLVLWLDEDLSLGGGRALSGQWLPYAYLN